MRFTADVAMVPRARHWVARAAEAAGAQGMTLRLVALLASELVTNAVLHGPAAGAVAVAVERRRGQLRVTVTDESDDPPRRLDPGPTAASGRGLMLVDRLSAAWGVDERPDGKAVWFELPL